ncbi:VWA domain-containing protein [Halopenitus persicus]|uniref:VWA domain containing CoxE-like protein n=1 Tax=Halopenitus persicus TaxID=1048396 RepID=A0A1H3NYW3_9EURY|nr:VWA domain-containing protein [Halopenitus persicus]SDY94066.1 hypothetical protein SAMN05216564_1174 [Halopenitus persicus]
MNPDGANRDDRSSNGQDRGVTVPDVPAFRAARDHVRDELVRFVRALRRADVAVPANAGPTAARALVEVGFDDEATARTALRACLISDAEDMSTFDRKFSEFWRRLTAGLDLDGPAPRWDDGPEGTLAPMHENATDDEPETNASETADHPDADPETNPVAASATLDAVVADSEPDVDADTVERSWVSPTGRRTRVSESVGIGPVDWLATAFDKLTRGLATLRGRRWRPGDERADVRRSLRSSIGTGGTIVSLPRRDREPDAVRAVWFVDVSRSVLDTIDRSFLLGTLRRARTEWRDCRIVLFDESARDVSEAFDESTAAAALDALDRAETEWGGGTRIGESLADFLADTPGAFDRRTVVFVVSDGLETGDADALEGALAPLSRRTAGIVWLNPLAVASKYEPRADGMASALPFIDGLFAFGGPNDLAEVGRQLRRHGLGGRIGYEYDPRRGVSEARRNDV